MPHAMKLLETPTLTGSHVRLEPLRLEHGVPLVRAASASRTTYGFTYVPQDLAGMRAYIEEALEDKARGASLPFVVMTPEGEPVGSTRYLAIEWWAWHGEPPPDVPVGPDGVEIGFTWYAEAHQRTGLNTEAKLLLCEHAFEVWRVRRVSFKTDSRNARSRAAIERIGAKLDGVLRAHRPAADGTVRDTAFFSMLAREWPASKEGMRRRLTPR